MNWNYPFRCFTWVKRMERGLGIFLTIGRSVLGHWLGTAEGAVFCPTSVSFVEEHGNKDKVTISDHLDRYIHIHTYIYILLKISSIVAQDEIGYCIRKSHILTPKRLTTVCTEHFCSIYYKWNIKTGRTAWYCWHWMTGASAESSQLWSFLYTACVLSPVLLGIQCTPRYL